MRKELRPLIAICAFILCANLGEGNDNKNVTDKSEPLFNFHGKIVLTNGDEFNSEKILIGGQFKNIPVHEVGMDPSTNHTDFDLAELSSLQTIDPQNIKNYNGRDYVTIRRTKKSGNQKDFIIRVDQEVSCSEADKSGPDRKNVKLNVIKEIHFTGHTKRVEPEELPATAPAA